MMYPFMTLDDGTEITHSEMLPDGQVKVYVEKPDEKDCFHHATFFLPSYEEGEHFGFSADETAQYLDIIRSTAHLILEFSQQGGVDCAAGF